MQEFKVLREHHGDKPYLRGDVRFADASEVAHLIRNGVLAPISLEDAQMLETRRFSAEEVSGSFQAIPVDAVEPSPLADETAEPEPKAQVADNTKAAKKAPENK